MPTPSTRPAARMPCPRRGSRRVLHLVHELVDHGRRRSLGRPGRRHDSEEEGSFSRRFLSVAWNASRRATSALAARLRPRGGRARACAAARCTCSGATRSATASSTRRAWRARTGPCSRRPRRSPGHSARSCAILAQLEFPRATKNLRRAGRVDSVRRRRPWRALALDGAQVARRRLARRVGRAGRWRRGRAARRSATATYATGGVEAEHVRTQRAWRASSRVWCRRRGLLANIVRAVAGIVAGLAGVTAGGGCRRALPPACWE